MGNYKDIEIEFVQRTLSILSQYEGVLHKFDFKEQYNYTLLVNCLLGLVILPKEKSISYLPAPILDETLREEMGLINTVIHNDYKDLKSLIIAIRHAASHFNIEIRSLDDNFYIDQIIFKNDENGSSIEVVNFRADELLPFLRYYASWLISNIENYKK